MGIWCEHFSCVEITKAKMDLFKKPTRHGAASRCHELNKANPQERWTVISAGNCYIPDYNKQKDAKQ